MLKIKDIFRCDSYLDCNHVLNEELPLNISTDSRTVISSDIFLAIEGEKFNPLNFLDQVRERGCTKVIYSKTESNDRLVEKYRDEMAFIQTKNTLTFFQELTSLLSVKFQDKGGKLIAISGSNGKTTTKEMLYHLLSESHPNTICTQKNNNNHLGVPLTLMQINDQTKFAIVELGSNHPGEIPVLCNIVKPAIGVTTNIGDTHLEFFENRENVFKEEGYLCVAVGHSPYAEKKFFVNLDDEFLNSYKEVDYAITFGKASGQYKFSIEKNKAIIENKEHEYIITNQFITGEHNFLNLCVAFIIAKEIDETNAEKFLKSAQSFRPTANRSQWIKKQNNEIFLDAYNANPSSMIAAIDGFVDRVGKDSNYCLILGDMNELGADSSTFHQNVAKQINDHGYKNFFFVGRYANDYNKGCHNLGKVYQDTQSLKAIFAHDVLAKYSYVFIKGSRSLQLESLVDIN